MAAVFCAKCGDEIYMPDELLPTIEDEGLYFCEWCQEDFVFDDMELEAAADGI